MSRLWGRERTSGHSKIITNILFSPKSKNSPICIVTPPSRPTTFVIACFQLYTLALSFMAWSPLEHVGTETLEMFFSPFCPRPRLKPFGKTPAQKLPPNWAVSGSKLFVWWWLLLPMPKPMLTIYRNPLATREKSLNLSRRRLFSRHLYLVHHFQCRCIEKKCILNLLKDTN